MVEGGTPPQEVVAMSEPLPTVSSDPTAIGVSLHDLAHVLREARHLEPETQLALADLLDELGRALTPALAASETAHLADSAAHVSAALHQRHNRGLLQRIKEQLEATAVRADDRAPVLAGILRRLIDTLANLGI